MQSASLYTDFGAIADLRERAVQSEHAALDEVAAQFESLFVQMMLKSMRDATIEGGLFSSHQLDTYQQMHDQQLSLEMSSGGGLGLAEMIVEQMRGAGVGEGPSSVLDADEPPISLSDIQAYLRHPLRSEVFESKIESGVSAMEAAAVTPGPTAFDARTPEEFIEALLPLARNAAEQLGVAPEVLIAQAALETGWGQRMTADRRGSSLNLFNIKASDDWPGRSVSVSTVEFRDGVARRENAHFRAYETLEDSFRDYVDLIRNSPRYERALEQATDAPSYLGELQEAGYATDPEYADKILNILQRGQLQAFFRG